MGKEKVKKNVVKGQGEKWEDEKEGSTGVD
jgi:hypothetical protein